ncbi:hypothetical protein MTO96_050783 [Rhipicephalus appendiculatus]
MKDSRHIFLVVQLLGVLSGYRPDHRWLPAVQIPCSCSASTDPDIICATAESSRVLESAAPSLLNSATACPIHEPRSTTSAISSRLIAGGLKAHVTCHPASGHGSTDRMKDSRHIFLVVQLLGVLSGHRPDHRWLPALQIPCSCSASTDPDIICATAESSRVLESAAPSLLNSATGCPIHEQRSTTSAKSSRLIAGGLKPHAPLPPRQCARKHGQNEGLTAHLSCCAAPGRSLRPSPGSSTASRRPNSVQLLGINRPGYHLRNR